MAPLVNKCRDLEQAMKQKKVRRLMATNLAREQQR
jgi:hypothetical protein